MDKIKRHADWQARAKAVIEAAKDKPFAYGRLDGVLFTGNVLKAITGRDVLRGMRGYRSLRGGLKNLKAKGFASPIDPFAAVLEEIPPMTAQPGDLVAFDGPMGDCMGVCMGAQAYAVEDGRGLGLTHMREAVRAFRVPV